MAVKIILPPCSDDPISDWLRGLTQAVCKATGDSGAGGLGGSYGYGSNYENDVFMLHRFCWCDQPDCPWCAGCTCPDDALRYFLKNGVEVGAEAFFDADGFISGTTLPVPEKQCPYCKGEVDRAPNFLHKATGATVHWYKYIGRGMEVSEANWPEIMAECFASLVDATPATVTDEDVERALNARLGLNTKIADMIAHPDQHDPVKGMQWKRAFMRAALEAFTNKETTDE